MLPRPKEDFFLRKNLDSLDLLKFILCLGIAAIHIAPLDSQNALLYPWLRMAVPLFFMMTSYFFFRKYDTLDTRVQKRQMLLHFVKRNAQLYGFWTLATLPVMWGYRKWFAGGFMAGMFSLARSVLFRSTFIASWFLAASIWGVALICLALRRIPWPAVVAFSAACYIVCCLCSNYYHISIESVPLFLQEYKAFCTAFNVPYNCFAAALYWVCMGRICTRVKPVRPAVGWPLAAGLALCLYGESQCVAALQAGSANDCYFLLMPLCPLLFLLFRDMRLQIACAAKLRVLSVVTFTLHGSLNLVLKNAAKAQGFALSGEMRYLITLLGCWGAALAILGLEKCRGLRWLRYAH
jgi:surface polysaccharide O-acyltransferase-like enzyme